MHIIPCNISLKNFLLYNMIFTHLVLIFNFLSDTIGVIHSFKINLLFTYKIVNNA